MQEIDMDLKSLRNKVPASLRGIIDVNPDKPIPMEELEVWKRKYDEFVEKDKKNKDYAPCESTVLLLCLKGGD